MVTGDPGDLGAHVTQQQAKDTDRDLAIIQHPKMEVLPVQGHLIQYQHVFKPTLFHVARYFLEIFNRSSC